MKLTLLTARINKLWADGPGGCGNATFSGAQILGNGWRLIISGPIGGGGWATWVEELILLISSCAGNTIFLQLRRNPCSEMIFHHLCVFYWYLTKFYSINIMLFLWCREICLTLVIHTLYSMVGAVHTCVLYSILWLGCRQQKPDNITQSGCFTKQKPDKKI